MLVSAVVNGGAQQRLRFVRAYWVTLVVVCSYSWTRLVGVVRGEQYVLRTLSRKHVLNARRIQRAIVRLQGLFIKVGQTFSILTNFLPPEFRKELEGLQDSVPPRPFAAIAKRFREDFGRDPLDVFAEFDETPLAAASISQVHLATTHDGDRVAVKVQYPDVDRMVRSDLKTFRRILKVIGLFFPAHGLELVHNEVSQMVLAELDFTAEANSIEVIGKHLAADPIDGVAVPVVFHELSTRRILTTGFVPGVNISNVERL
ncbi:MAG: ubiquinone biosynthesis protein, partial [Myxococcota bacterium]